MTSAQSQPYYLDVTHPDANKGGVVKYLSARFGIPSSAIATIGDMPNDVLMFAHSGLSIAMGSRQRSATGCPPGDDDESGRGLRQRCRTIHPGRAATPSLTPRRPDRRFTHGPRRLGGYGPSFSSGHVAVPTDPSATTITSAASPS